ncbi:MAG: hypothetical protein AAGC93_25635 [Cyanobacteria bacterium P01_F01_bin.53]
MFKSALPLALATSPLLLAASQPPVLDSIGADCRLESSADQAPVVLESSEAMEQLAVQPIAAYNGALVTSQQEMSIFSTERWGTALRLLLDNPYILEQPSFGGLAPTPEQNRCISLETEGQPDMQAANVASVASLPVANIQDFSKTDTAAIGTTAVLSATDFSKQDFSKQDFSQQDFSKQELEAEVPDETVAPEPENTDPEPLPDLENEPVLEEAAPAATPTPEAPATEAAPEEVEIDPSVNPTNVTPAAGSPTPFDGSVVVTLESLPDGNYRYIAGESEQTVYTNEELLARGGSLFLLSKEGDTVTGDLMPRFGLPGICVTGTVSGDTVTGAAYPYDTTDTLQDSAREIGETYEPHASGALQIRRTRTDNRGLYYAGALMDVSNFTLINAGSSLPPTSCTVGRTGGRDQD